MSEPQDHIDFSQTPRLEVRPELFEEMLARRKARADANSKPSTTTTVPADQARTSAKIVSLPQTKNRWKMPMAIAASLLCVAGATFFAIDNSSPSHATTAIASAATSSFSTANQLASSTSAKTTDDALAETVDWYGSLGEGGSSEQLVVADAIFQSF